jgi:hypothetical protein
MFAYYGPEWESLASRMVDRWCTSWTGNTGLQFPSTMGRNHGVLTNFANNGNDAYVASPDRLALGFDGFNDYVSFAKNPIGATLQNNYSMTVWVRKASGNNGAIISQYTSTTAHRLIRILAYGATEFAYYSSTAAGTFQRVAYSTIPTLGQLHFFSVVVSGPDSSPTCRLGLNGVEQTFSLSALSATPDASVPIYLGCTNSGGSPAEFASYAAYDDLTIFNAPLTASEVRFIYEQGRGGGMLYQPPRRRSVAAVIAALVLACETANYSLTGQAAGLFASRLLAADQAQYILSGNAANITASRLLSADPASYTATGNDAATICARLLDGGAAAYALTGTNAGLIANRKLTADQAVCFLAGNNAELLRSLKLNAGSMAMQIDNFAASLLADRKISADGAQYILVVSDANLTGSASGVAPYYYLFMMRGPQ